MSEQPLVVLGSVHSSIAPARWSVSSIRTIHYFLVLKALTLSCDLSNQRLKMLFQIFSYEEKLKLCYDFVAYFEDTLDVNKLVESFILFKRYEAFLNVFNEAL